MKVIIRPLSVIMLLCTAALSAQNIENAEAISSFTNRLEEKKVSQVLFIGDSHIQADWLPGYLRKKFQAKYGNAGRGLVFPYNLGNTNGADDFSSSSNKAWETFRLVHDQKIFPKIGASGFVIGNKENSFIEIQFKNPEDSFDKVVIFHDEDMDRKKFTMYTETESLNRFIEKKSEILNHTAAKNETFHEIVSKYNTTTTRLRKLNGDRILRPSEGNIFKVERNYPVYNSDFEQKITEIGKYTFTGFKTTVSMLSPQQTFLMRSDIPEGSTFYGFQFLKNTEKGVVFNTVGVNGATYGDFLKYPLQVQQLLTLDSNLVIIALGTNEVFSDITKEEFQTNVSSLVEKIRSANPQLPILLIAPPDNMPKQSRVPEIVSWLKESAQKYNLAFFDLYRATGGKGYFKKALMKNEANKDGVHYTKTGYENQGEIIWNAFSSIKNTSK